MRPPIRLPEPTPEAIAELDELYRTTRDVRLRMGAQLVLLAAEQQYPLNNPGEARMDRADLELPACQGQRS